MGVFTVSRQTALKDVPTMEGKVVIVTGGNGGIGFGAASVFVQKKAKVVLACRSESSASKAVERLKESYPEGDVSYIVLDVTKKESIDNFVAQFTEQYDKLNVLVHNAGVASPPKNATEEFNVGVIYAVNFVGPHVLNMKLLAHLEKGAEANGEVSRIVNVSSGVAGFAKDIDYDNLDGQKKMKSMTRYGESKLGVMLLGTALNKKMKESDKKVMVVNCHPGFARSKMSRGVAGPANFFAQNPFMGGLPTVAAATDPKLIPGAYYGPKYEMWGVPKLIKPPKASMDENKAANLWAKVVELTGQAYP